MAHPLVVRDNQAAADRGVLVYVHGLGESSLSMAELLADPRLEGWRVIGVDLPGYGRTPPRPAHAGMLDHADTLGAWIADSGLGPVVLLGHSMGGVIALACAERHRAHIRAVLDVEGNVTVEDCGYSAPIADIARDRWPSPGAAEIREQVWSRAQADEAHRRYFVSLAFADPAVLRQDALDLVAWSARGDLAERRGRLEVPFHYIAGLPGGAGVASRGALEQAGVAWSGVEPAGHWPFVDQYGRFVELVLAFLAGLPSV